LIVAAPNPADIIASVALTGSRRIAFSYIEGQLTSSAAQCAAARSGWIAWRSQSLLHAEKLAEVDA
jgi:hypothetical protein